MKILVIKTSSLGDLVHCLPAVNDIAQNLPGSEIHWLAEESFADVARLSFPVSKVATCAMRKWRRRLSSKETWREIAALQSWIKQQEYDCIIDFQGLLKSAFWCRGLLAKRHGYDWRSARESLASLFYNQRHTVSKGLHAIERNRLLAAKSFDYEVPDYLGQLDFAIKDTPVRRKQVVFLHGTSRESKSLAVPRWQALTQKFHSAGFQVLVPWHSRKEYEEAKDIAGLTGKVLDKMSVAELVPILASSMLAVSVDTGLAHLACALKTPTLTIFFDSDPNLTGVIGDGCLNLTAEELSLGKGSVLPNIKTVDTSDAEVVFQCAKALVL